MSSVLTLAHASIKATKRPVRSFPALQDKTTLERGSFSRAASADSSTASILSCACRSSRRFIPNRPRSLNDERATRCNGCPQIIRQSAENRCCQLMSAIKARRKCEGDWNTGRVNRFMHSGSVVRSTGGPSLLERRSTMVAADWNKAGSNSRCATGYAQRYSRVLRKSGMPCATSRKLAGRLTHDGACSPSDAITTNAQQLDMPLRNASRPPPFPVPQALLQHAASVSTALHADLSA
mmetsp:Transcript_12050/g.32446  ORF Transcript_12050/g.32446 Transcript_12050/m.32446 type:complete len:237 (+) Transcript_12050:315-1025(+)